MRGAALRRRGGARCSSPRRQAPQQPPIRGLTGARRVRPGLRRHPRRPVHGRSSPFSRRPARRPRAKPASCSRPCSAVVADPARPLQPHARCRVRVAGRAAIAAIEAWTAREPSAGRGLVLPGRRVRRARAVAGAARRAAGRRARRRAHQGGARARARARPGDGRRLLRHRPLPLLRRRRARRQPVCCGGCCCCPAAIAPAGSRRCTRARAADCSCATRPTTSCTSSTSGTRSRPSARSSTLAGLTERHPRNPHFRQATAEIQDFYIDDTAASLRTWQALLDAARRREVEAPEMAEVSARLGIASQLDQLSQSEAALEHLRAVIASRPSAPFGAVARAQLQLGERSSISAAAQSRQRRTARRSRPPAATIRCGSHARARDRIARAAVKFIAH